MYRPVEQESKRYKLCFTTDGFTLDSLSEGDFSCCFPQRLEQLQLQKESPMLEKKLKNLERHVVNPPLNLRVNKNAKRQEC